MGALNLAAVALEGARLLVALIMLAVQAPPHTVEPVAAVEPAPAELAPDPFAHNEDW